MLNYTEEQNLARIAEIYAILDFLEKNKTYPLKFGSRWAISSGATLLLSNLALRIIYSSHPELLSLSRKVTDLLNSMSNNILLSSAKGLNSAAALGKSVQLSVDEPLTIMRSYFEALGQFASAYSGGIISKDYFLRELPAQPINCTANNTANNISNILLSQAVNSINTMVNTIYPDHPDMRKPEIINYFKSLGSNAARLVSHNQLFIEQIMVPTTKIINGMHESTLRKINISQELIGDSVKTLITCCNMLYGVFLLELGQARINAINLTNNLILSLIALINYIFSSTVVQLIPLTKFLNFTLPGEITDGLNEITTLTNNNKHKELTLKTKDLLERLRKTKSNTIHWEKCINTLLAILVILLIIAFLIDYLNIHTNMGLKTIGLGGLFGEGFKELLTMLFAYFFSNSTIRITQSNTLLNHALLPASYPVLANNFELVRAITSQGETQPKWDQIQFIFKPKNPARLTRKELHAIITVVAKELSFYNIRNVLISVNRHTAIYINASSAHKALATFYGSANKNVNNIAQKLEMALTRLALIADLKTKMFAILHKRNIIAGYWLDDKPGSIDYEILDGKEWNAFLAECTEFSKFMKKDRFSCHVNQATVESVIRAVQTTLSLATQPATAGPMPTESETAVRRKRAKAPQVIAAEPVAPAPAVLAEAHRWALPNNRNVTSNDDNIAMIWDTRNYEHPIFVMNDLAVENFNSDFTYDTACTQLENPRYAARRGQQGLFITENKQTITLKLLGQMDARGNVRCSNESPPIVSTLGSSLYIIDTVNNNAHD